MLKGAWINTAVYQRLNIVKASNGFLYIAKQAFPAGTALTDTDYWMLMADSNTNDVLEARMDTFTHLEEGSTTGDAELADIRVGADGTTYDSAGTAVRNQIADLKSALDIENIPFRNGYLYRTTDSSIDINNPTANTGGACAFAEVSYMDQILITCKGTASYNSLALLDEDGNILVNYNNKYNDYLYTIISSEAKYIILNNVHTQSNKYYAYKGNPKFEEFKTLVPINRGQTSKISPELLSECNKNGWYHDTSAKMELLIDKPDGFPSVGGPFLEVINNSFGTDSSNYITQFLHSIKGDCWFRIIGYGDWIKISEKITDYNNLYISLLGDSGSAYAGYIPPENVAYYTGSNYNINSVNKMWWKIAIDKMGGTPLIVDAWSGSCVASGVRTATSSNSYLAQSDISRCQRLHAYVPGTASDYDLIVTSENINTIRTSPFLEAYTPAIGDYVKRIDPDIIFCTGGGNDYSYNCQLGSWDGHTDLDTSDTSTFREAYANMINRIQNEYPKALVICFVPFFLVRPAFSVHDKDQVNRNSIGNTYYDYQKIMKEIAGLIGCPVVDLYSLGFNRKNYYDTFCSDSSSSPTHPNALGQSIMGNSVASKLKYICEGYVDYLQSL